MVVVAFERLPSWQESRTCLLVVAVVGGRLYLGIIAVAIEWIVVLSN